MNNIHRYSAFMIDVSSSGYGLMAQGSQLMAQKIRCISGHLGSLSIECLQSANLDYRGFSAGFALLKKRRIVLL